MSIIPEKKVDQVQFCETHAPVWAAAPAAIGLTAAQCTGFTTLTTNARKAYDAAQSAKQAYHAAVTSQDTALTLATNAAADLIRVIKGYAEQQANPNTIYSLAQIPPPAQPVPAPKPGQPTNVTVGLEPSGAITLRWKSINAAPNAGTYFTIVRKLAGDSNFVLVGNTGEKSWTDFSLTQGTPSAVYIIQGHRGAVDGDASEQIGVQFGVGGGGGFAVSNATKDAGLKMAA